MSVHKARAVTEKTVATSNNSNPKDCEFTSSINEIYNHINNGSITKPIFKSFVDKVYAQIDHYKHKKATPNKQPLIAPSIPETDSATLIAESTLVTSFSDIHGRSPKSKLFVEFYPQFLAFITPSKSQNNSIKCIIEYDIIDRIIAVPLKNDDTLLYIQLSRKIPLKYKKSSIDCFSVTFEDLSHYEDCTEEIEICNMNTSLPPKLNGTKESLFCRVLSDLTHKNIDRHDKALFRTINDSNKTVFYIDASMKFNKVSVYPLRCGLFITPKPLRFVAQSTIKYYEYSREGNGLRYFDFEIALEAADDGKEEENMKKTKKKKNNAIDLTMIPKKEMDAIDHYFREMKIELKREGKATPLRKNKNKNKENQDEESMDEDDEDDDDEEMNEISDSDDEEYKVEEDNCDYSDSNMSDEDEDEDDVDMKNVSDGIGSVEMASKHESEDLIVESSNSPLISPRKAKKRKKTPKKRVLNKNKKRKRKRKRAEMESDDAKKKKKKQIEIINLDDSDDDDDIDRSPSRKRPRIRKGFGRKTTNYGNGKIVSKEIPKKNKKSPKRNNNKSNKVYKCVDCDRTFKNGLALGGHRASKHRKKKDSPKKDKNKKRNKKKSVLLVPDEEQKEKERNQKTLLDMFDTTQS